jgi:hypothetical protein
MTGRGRLLTLVSSNNDPLPLCSHYINYVIGILAATKS